MPLGTLVPGTGTDTGTMSIRSLLGAFPISLAPPVVA